MAFCVQSPAVSDDLTPRRYVVREGEWQRHGLTTIAQQANVSRAEAAALLQEVAARLAGAVRAREALQMSSGRFRVDQCAGLLRIAPSLELEIVPKFLSSNDPSWREDFFLIATIAGARLLLSERLHTDRNESRDLPTLVGAAMVGAYRANERHPIRTYRRRRILEYSLDGDVEPESLLLPDSEGFSQDLITLDRQNEFNAVLRAAVQTLLPEVSHPETRVQLMRVFERLSPQARLRGVPRARSVPSRHLVWRPAYDLAVQVLRGFGSVYATDGVASPGFVLNTWRAWQDLLSAAISSGLPDYDVRVQRPLWFGTRHAATVDWTTTQKRRATVTPDVALHVLGTGEPTLVVDAKYKLARGRFDDPKRPRIGESDLYEMLAFLAASKTQHAILLYPRQSADADRSEAGTVIPFERVTSGDAAIWGAEVEVRGIAGRGFFAFAQSLGDGLRRALAAQ